MIGKSHSLQAVRLRPVNIDMESTHLSAKIYCPVTIFDFDLRRPFKNYRLVNSGVTISFFFLKVVRRFPFNLLNLSG